MRREQPAVEWLAALSSSLQPRLVREDLNNQPFSHERLKSSVFKNLVIFFRRYHLSMNININYIALFKLIFSKLYDFAV